MNKSNSNIKECCSKCLVEGYEFEPGEISPTESHCSNDTCPCHSSQECEVEKKTGGHYFTEGGTRMCCPDPTPVATEYWIESAKKELENVVHVWMKIGEEINPVLADFISSYKKIWEEKAYQRGQGEGHDWGFDSAREEEKTRLIKIVEGKKIPCIGNPEMMLGIEDRVKNTTLDDIINAIKEK